MSAGAALVAALRDCVRQCAVWSRSLLFQAALKYSTPATDVPAETAEYERAVMRNYSDDECMEHFTPLQVQRMVDAAASYRPRLGR